MVQDKSLRPSGRQRRLAGTSARRHRIRVFLLLIFVAIPLLVGWLFRPRVQVPPGVVGPSVVVLASRPGVAALVNANLSIGYRHDRPGSELQLRLLATRKISGTVQLAVELNDFPSGTTVVGAKIVRVRPPAAGSAIGSLPLAAEPYQPGYRDYAFPATLTQPQNSSVALQTITIRAPKPIGEASQGYQLRVALPFLRGEGPGANASVAYQIRDLFPGAVSLAGSRHGYPVVLQAGTSTFSDSGHSLSGYQVLAGDPPTLLGTANWAWHGINDATVLAANVHAQGIDQLKVFYSGLALGLAVAAFMTLLLELIPTDSGTDSTDKQTSGRAPADGDESKGQPAKLGSESAEGLGSDSAPVEGDAVAGQPAPDRSGRAEDSH
jgi:hypothetical protein